MSDFLTHLVERSGAANVAVRPQLFSIFEPPSADAGTFFRDSENWQEDQQEPADLLSPSQSSGNATFEPTPRPVAAVSKAELTSEPPGPPGASRVPPRIDLPAKHQDASPPSARPDSSGAVKDEERAFKSHRPRLSSQIRLPFDPPRKQESEASRRENRRAADATGKDKQEAAAFRPQFPPEHRSRVPSAPELLPSDSRKERLPELHPRKIVEMTTREPGGRLEPAQVRPIYAVPPRPPSPKPIDHMGQEKNPPAAPAINITIGRVEVRATRSPPSRPQPAPASAPVMSLEEYLRERAGGDRR